MVPAETGALIPPGDAAAMAEAAAMFLDSPDNLAARSRAARTHVERNFRIEHEAAALTALYRDMLHSP